MSMVAIDGTRGYEKDENLAVTLWGKWGNIG